MIVWCAYFFMAHDQKTFDASRHTQKEVLTYAKNYDYGLSVVRQGFSMMVGEAFGQIVVAALVPSRLRDDSFHLGRWVVSLLIPFAAGLPFSGLTAQFESVSYSPAFSSADLGKFDMMESDWTSIDNSYLPQGNASRETARTATTDTILRRVILPPRNKVRSCDIQDGQQGNEYTNIAYDFMANAWQQFVLPQGLDPVETYTVFGTPAVPLNVSIKQSFTTKEARLVQSLFTRAVYLYVDAALAVDASEGGVWSAALTQLKLDTIAYAATNASATPNTSYLSPYVRDYFAQLPTWQTVLNATISNITVEYAVFNLSDTIQFSSVSLNIPLDNTIWHRQLAPVNGKLVDQGTVWPGFGPVEYEIDVANECGPRSCGVFNRGLATEPKVIAYGDCSDSGGLNCTGETKNSSMWLAGFGRRIQGQSFTLLNSTDPHLRKAVVRNPQEYHRVTMGYLTFQSHDLAKVYDARCHAPSCRGTSFQYFDPVVDSAMVLLVGFNNTPMIDFGSSFDLQKNLARGRPILSRYSTKARADFEILQPKNFDSYSWKDTLKADNCSGRMERSIISNDLNFVYMENPLQATYTAGIFFLFNDARSVEQMQFNDGTPFLDLVGSSKRYGISFVVPFWYGIIGLVYGALYGVLLIGAMKKRDPSLVTFASEKMRDPSVFVRVLADSINFPKKCVDVFVRPPGVNTKTMDLRELGIRSIEMGPLPPDSRSSVASIVIRDETVRAKEIKYYDLSGKVPKLCSDAQTAK